MKMKRIVEAVENKDVNFVPGTCGQSKSDGQKNNKSNILDVDASQDIDFCTRGG